MKNHIQDELVKFQELALVISFVIFPQKSQLRLTNENFEISRNSAYPKSHKEIISLCADLIVLPDSMP